MMASTLKLPGSWRGGNSRKVLRKSCATNAAALRVYMRRADQSPQPMVSQMRAVLEQYKENGGAYEELIIADTAHSPFIETPEEFNQAFHSHLG